jgi:hypothetical protein
MPRQDGRIEQGQSLKSAISARAWNRAQDAADIVLGQRYGLKEGTGVAAGPGALVVPCNVSTTVQNVSVGHVVKITASGATRVPTVSDQTAVASVSTLEAQVIQPVTVDGYPEAKCQLGVIVGGTTMPKPGAPSIVMVCISGLCVARVRPRYAIQALLDVGPYKFIQGPVTRPGDTAANLIGAAEACSCGIQRIIQYLGDVPGFAGPGFMPDELNYAVVLL